MMTFILQALSACLTNMHYIKSFTQGQTGSKFKHKNVQQDPFCVCMFKIENVETAFLFTCSFILQKVAHMHLESFDQGVK